MLERLRWLWRGDGFLALLFTALLLAYLAGATQLRGGLLSDVVGPRTYPVLLALLGLGLCALFFAQKLMAGPTDDAEATDETDPGETVIGRQPHLIPLFLTLAYALAFTTAGYLLSTFVYVTVILKLLGQRTWWGSAAFGAGLTAASFVLFAHVFEVRLPPGDILPSPF